MNSQYQPPGVYIGKLFKIFPDNFDDVWANKCAIKAERMAQRYRKGVRPEVVYNHIYRLSEFLWKLKVWKP